MPRKRNTPAASPTKAAATPLSHRLHALLQTIRCIAQHEDQLCTLLHEAQRTRRISARLRKDLVTLLNELPTEEYTADLRALEDELTTV